MGQLGNKDVLNCARWFLNRVRFFNRARELLNCASQLLNLSCWVVIVAVLNDRWWIVVCDLRIVSESGLSLYKGSVRRQWRSHNIDTWHTCKQVPKGYTLARHWATYKQPNMLFELLPTSSASTTETYQNHQFVWSHLSHLFISNLTCWQMFTLIFTLIFTLSQSSLLRIPWIDFMRQQLNQLRLGCAWSGWHIVAASNWSGSSGESMSSIGFSLPTSALLGLDMVME